MIELETRPGVELAEKLAAQVVQLAERVVPEPSEQVAERLGQVVVGALEYRHKRQMNLKRDFVAPVALPAVGEQVGLLAEVRTVAQLDSLAKGRIERLAGRLWEVFAHRLEHQWAVKLHPEYLSDHPQDRLDLLAAGLLVVGHHYFLLHREDHLVEE